MSITIWLKPAKYALNATLVVNIVGQDARLSIRTRPRDTASATLGSHSVTGPAAIPAAPEDPMDIDERTDDDRSSTSNSSSGSSCRVASPIEIASLVMDTKECNMSLLCLQQGSLELEHLAVEHFSEVQLMQLMRNKNENAAILIKSSQSPWPSINPSLHLISVSLRSYSGKGILNRAGGMVTVSDSFVARTW